MSYPALLQGPAVRPTSATFLRFAIPARRLVRASRFVAGKSFQKVLIGIDNRTTLMLGHTRWRMRGDEKVSANNHLMQASFYRQVLVPVAICGAGETAWT